MSKPGQPTKTENESVALEETGDLSNIYGNWGRWQMLCFFLVGFAVIICSQPTLIMTFMNAKIDFWCKRPENLLYMEVEDWKALSGEQVGSCQILNITYGEMTLIEAKRYIIINQLVFRPLLVFNLI